MSILRARHFRRNMSPPEAALWNVLRAAPLRSFHFRRQVPIGPFYADFASHTAKLVIEVDGGQHTTDAAIAHDRRRDDFLAAQGYHVLRINTVDVLRNVGGVVQAILAMEPRGP